MTIDVDDILLVKRGSPSTWTELNPILRAGEIGFEKVTYRLKVGDGVTPWNDLAYITTSSEDVPGLSDLIADLIAADVELDARLTTVEGDPRWTDARTPTLHNHPTAQISDSTAIGRSLLTAASQEAARAAISAVSQMEQGATIGISSVVDGTVVVSIQTPWGIRGDGTPYYNEAGALPGEEAVLDINPETGSPRLTKLGEGTPYVLDLIKTVDSVVGDGRLALTNAERATIAQVTGSTVVGRSLLTADDAGTARTSIGLGDAATRNVGTTAGTVAAGDDSRLTDPRTPTAHTHPATQISDSTTTGRSLVTASDAATARAVIEAVTSVDISNAVNSLVGGAPGALDTLNELAAALGDDENFAGTVTNQLADLDTRVDAAEADLAAATPDATANRIVKRNGVGDIGVASAYTWHVYLGGPTTAADHAARKDYVDAAIATASASLSQRIRSARYAGLVG